MDFDIGSLIYILVTIVAIVAGVAGKKKKKRSLTNSPSGEEKASSPAGGFFSKLEKQLENFTAETSNSFENLKQEPLVSEEEVVVEKDYFESRFEQVEQETHDDLSSKMATYEGIFNPNDEKNSELLASEGISVTDPLELVDLEQDVYNDFDQAKITEAFDLRAAVIYSTIINRIEI